MSHSSRSAGGLSRNPDEAGQASQQAQPCLWSHPSDGPSLCLVEGGGGGASQLRALGSLTSSNAGLVVTASFLPASLRAQGRGFRNRAFQPWGQDTAPQTYLLKGEGAPLAMRCSWFSGALEEASLSLQASVTMIRHLLSPPL